MFSFLFLGEMEIIDNNVDKNGGTGWEIVGSMNQQLFEVIEKWKWGDLECLLEWYFSMIDHLWEVGYLFDNLDYYEKSLSELLAFSNQPFMEWSFWKFSDNGQFKESYWAHLRNLLSPFKNMIAVIRSLSRWEFGEIDYTMFVSKFRVDLEDNKKDFLEFCILLEN